MASLPEHLMRCRLDEIMLARIINIKIQKLWIKYDGMMQSVVMCPKLMKLTGIDKVEFTGLHLIRCSGNDAM